MTDISLAKINDAAEINAITKRAFLLYQSELPASTPVKALRETDGEVIEDIKNHRVFVAKENGKIVGAIRYCALNDDIAYIYRFGVDPSVSSSGIGSDLLETVILECTQNNFKAITLHTNSKYYKLARYYYGKQFFVHSTTTDKGYIRALFVKELKDENYDVSVAFKR